MSEVFQFEAFFKVIPEILKALPITLMIGSASMVFGLIIGTIIGVIRNSEKKANVFLSLYVSFFRGTPLMVQLFIFYYGLPQLIPSIASLNAIEASIIVMSINASAYISEVIRSSLSSVPESQSDAAYATGMSRIQTLRYITLPQAFRIAIPPLGNTFISIIQGTAITFMLGVKDIMGISKMRAAANFRFLETYIAVALVYWALTIISTKINQRLEMNFSKGYLKG